MKSYRKSKNNLLLEPAPERHALAEIDDTNQLQSLFESFYHLTGFGNAVVDNFGKVLVANGWQDICARFHRIHPETKAHCLASDIELASIEQPGKFVIYKCRNNMAVKYGPRALFVTVQPFISRLAPSTLLN